MVEYTHSPPHLSHPIPEGENHPSNPSPTLLRAQERSHSKSTADLGPVLDTALDLVAKTWKEKMCPLGCGPEWSQHRGSPPGWHQNYLGELKKKLRPKVPPSEILI